MKLMVLSDTHIPDRALRLPNEIESFLDRRDFLKVVHAGDLTDERVLAYLKTFGDVVVVRGNMDYLPLPRHQIFELEKLRFGVVHGHGIYPRGDRRQLLSIAKELGVDVLISGHTHSPDVHFDEGILLINPGSATGAWGGGGGSGVPSFMMLEVSGGNVKVNLFEIKAKLSVKRFAFDIK